MAYGNNVSRKNKNQTNSWFSSTSLSLLKELHPLHRSVNTHTGLRSLLADVGPSEETTTLRNQPQEGNQGRTVVERDALGSG
jgi:hypothetical protein